MRPKIYRDSKKFYIDCEPFRHLGIREISADRKNGTFECFWRITLDSDQNLSFYRGGYEDSINSIVKEAPHYVKCYEEREHDTHQSRKQDEEYQRTVKP